MRHATPPRRLLSGLIVLAAGLGCTGAAAFAAAPEKPVTEPATAITGTSATLKGELNPNTTAKTGYQFAYNANGTCKEGATTTQAPEKTGTKLKVSTPVAGLEGSTEYTVCVLATHLEGEILETTAGLELKFKTLAAKPAVEAEHSSGVTPFKVTLEATVNPENQPTTGCSFEYGKTNKYGTAAPCEPASLEGSTSATVAAAVAALEPATTYHYRVAVKNATGETKGADTQLTTLTLERPLVSGGSVSGLTATSAKLEAVVNPNYQQTTYAFEYATNEALTGASTIEGAAPLEAEFVEHPVSVEVTGLQPGKIYYYRARAANATGSSPGGVHSFQTLAAPAVAAPEASNATRTTVQLSGAINPAGAETTYHVAYVPGAEYEPFATNRYAKGRTTAESAPLGSDNAYHAVGPATVEELTPGTTYHYALVARNSIGTTVGPDATFTTAAPTPPVPTTGAAEAISQLSATITGSVETHGLQTIAEFQFGTSPGQGALIPAPTTSNSGTVNTVAVAFNGDLRAGTTYYYRLIARSPDGTSYGAEQALTTSAFPTPLTAPTLPPFIPYISIAQLDARETAEAPRSPAGGPLTNGQKLAKALKACRRTPRKQRLSCERKAKRRYPRAKNKPRAKNRR